MIYTFDYIDRYDSLPLLFNHTTTTKIYTLSLHDALPISVTVSSGGDSGWARASTGTAESSDARAAMEREARVGNVAIRRDRKSTRLNSSHSSISYAVFCLKKKKYKYNSYISYMYFPYIR